MERISFRPTFSDGDESVMSLGEIIPDQIRYNRKTREIIICCSDTYSTEDLDQESWQSIKKLVEKNGGIWTSKNRGIAFESQKWLSLVYKGETLEQKYKADIVCYDKIIVEIKAVRETTGEHRAQVFNYLKASGLRLGLLVNFGHYPKATIERIVL